MRLSSVVGILDTEDIAHYVFPPPYEPRAFRLNNLLRRLQCPYDKLHTAGNDANFTLRVVLLLAIESCREELLDSAARERLYRIETMARAPLPNHSSLVERNTP